MSFPPGSLHTGRVPVTVTPVKLAGQACQAELYLGPDPNTKAATSGPVPFTATGALQSLNLPVVMPAAGTYHVYRNISAGGLLFSASQDTSDVVVQTAGPTPITLTIDHTKFRTPQVDFPVMVRLSTSSGISRADVTRIFSELSYANRHKFSIMQNGSPCWVEIVRWDNAAQVAILHVRVPSVSSTVDAILSLSFDHTQADNPYVGDVGSVAGQNVWGTNYTAVLHLSELAEPYLDSTVYGNHGMAGRYDGVPKPPAPQYDELGIPCQMFAGDGALRSSFIQIPNPADQGLSIPIPGGFTVEIAISPHFADFSTLWIENKTMPWAPFLTKANPNSDQEWMCDIYDKTGKGEGRIDWMNWYNCNPAGGQADGSNTTGAIPLDTWVLLQGVSKCTDADHGTAEQFRNGVSQGSVADWATGNGGAIIHYVPGPAPVKIGCWDVGNGGLWFPGRGKEVRISKIPRSPDWNFASNYSLIDRLVTFS
jgi:hypothetical protein